MTKIRLFVLIGLLLVIAAEALFIFRGTDTQVGNFIFSNPVTPALLFFVFFGAVAGVMKIVVDATLPNRMTKVDSSSWERTRAKGKLSYVLDALLLAGLPIIVTFAIYVAQTELNSYIIRNFIALILVLLGGVVAISLASWKYYESIYSKSRERNSKSGDAFSSTKE